MKKLAGQGKWWHINDHPNPALVSSTQCKARARSRWSPSHPEYHTTSETKPHLCIIQCEGFSHYSRGRPQLAQELLSCQLRLRNPHFFNFFFNLITVVVLSSTLLSVCAYTASIPANHHDDIRICNRTYQVFQDVIILISRTDLRN